MKLKTRCEYEGCQSEQTNKFKRLNSEKYKGKENAPITLCNKHAELHLLLNMQHVDKAKNTWYDRNQNK